MSCINHVPIAFTGYPDAYPSWADGVGWLMVAIALVWIPVLAVIEYGRTHDWIAVSVVIKILNKCMLSGFIVCLII